MHTVFSMFILFTYFADTTERNNGFVKSLFLLRLRLHGIGYIQIRLGSDSLWYGSTVFTRDRFEIGTVRLHRGSPS